MLPCYLVSMIKNVDIKTARRIAREHNNGSNPVAGQEIFSLSIADVLALNTEFAPMVRKGTTDEVTECDLCGKTNLKKTVVFRILDGGDDIHLGCDCAESYKFATGRF